MNTPIKPCPRCGGVDSVELEEVEGLWMGLDSELRNHVMQHVHCINCGFAAMVAEADDTELAIKLWNDEPDLSGKPIIFRDQVLAYLLGQVHTQNNLVEWYAKDPTILIRYKDESDAFIAEIYLKEE